MKSMNYIKKVLLILFAASSLASAQPYLLDKICVVVFSEESTEIITQSDLERPGLDGSPRSLNDLILEKLVFADAKKMKIVADEEAVDRHLMSVQKDNNLTLDQLKEIFKSAGYSYEEGRAQFGVMTTVNSMLDFKIRSRLMIPEKEITAYYDEHPEIEEAQYKLVKTIVPYADDREQQQIKLNPPSKSTIAGLAWSEPFWITQSELAEDKQFITSLPAGAVAAPQETPEGFELFRMIERKEERLKPLLDRYQEITEALRKPRYDKLFAEYKKELFDNASLVYFD